MTNFKICPCYDCIVNQTCEETVKSCPVYARYRRIFGAAECEICRRCGFINKMLNDLEPKEVVAKASRNCVFTKGFLKDLQI